MASPARMERVVLQVRQVPGARWVFRAFVVGAGLQVLLASLVLVVSLDHMAVPATTAPKALPVPAASPAKTATTESPPSCLVNQALPALPVETVVLVLMAAPDLLAKTAEMEKMVAEGVVGLLASQVSPVIPVKMAKMADLVRWASLVRTASMARMAGTAVMVSMAILACQAEMDATVVTALPEKSALLVPKVMSATLDLKVLLVLPAPVAPRATKATLVLKALVVLKVLRGPAAKLVSMARTAFK
jgi:hypothetical protein